MGKKIAIVSTLAAVIFVSGFLVANPSKEALAVNPVIILINDQVIPKLEQILSLLTNSNFGLEEIKNQVRNIENRQTNEILGPGGDYIQPVVLSLEFQDRRTGFPSPVPVDLAGEMFLRWSDPVTDPTSGSRIIQVEMNSLSLTGFHPSLGDIKVTTPISAPGELRLGPPGSDFQVDSFFDITYRIEFTGAPGGALAGFGQTSAPVRQIPDPDYPWTRFPPPELPLREEVLDCHNLVDRAGNLVDFNICFLVLTPTTQPTLMIKKELIQLEKELVGLLPIILPEQDPLPPTRCEKRCSAEYGSCLGRNSPLLCDVILESCLRDCVAPPSEGNRLFCFCEVGGIELPNFCISDCNIAQETCDDICLSIGAGKSLVVECDPSSCTPSNGN